ncbi:cytochrome c peroxidase [Gallaecimonas kandeliae]|uniref:cytochrome-c peroxidase n=1 Tax=Gallaecimonas kandeliae TaxID=3029055 RepID=UPI0026498E44|nr:cytochrome c peroxidase [Gallaecimonas kandeliae]WKE64425.1 cytochrome c peroxidase [Gallaecimonas kandeliae]
MRLLFLFALLPFFLQAAEDVQALQRSHIQAQRAKVLAMQALGEKLFHDPALSGSGALACASCHQQSLGFSSPLALMPGGKKLLQKGNRAVPGLTYLQSVPAFTEHFFENDGDDSIDNGATGGLTWDGRVDRVQQQVQIPLFAGNEMASSPAIIAAAIDKAPYRAQFEALFGKALQQSPDKILAGVANSLAAYLHSPVFYPYSSKFDAVMAGKASFTAQEARGLAAFNDPAKGNCASCHFSSPDASGAPARFTDFGMIALGLPRNMAISENVDKTHFDLGLCGPLRTDLKDQARYCGLFRAPSLRNVALRTHFFHNGVITSLHDAIAFYATRDTDPGRWYPKGPDGKVQKFNDLPQEYWGNINRDPPFGGKPGDAPAFSEQDIEDIEAFLGTLSDGYQP